MDCRQAANSIFTTVQVILFSQLAPICSHILGRSRSLPQQQLSHLLRSNSSTTRAPSRPSVAGELMLMQIVDRTVAIVIAHPMASLLGGSCQPRWPIHKRNNHLSLEQFKAPILMLMVVHKGCIVAIRCKQFLSIGFDNDFVFDSRMYFPHKAHQFAQNAAKREFVLKAANFMSVFLRMRMKASSTLGGSSG